MVFNKRKASLILKASVFSTTLAVTSTIIASEAQETGRYQVTVNIAYKAIIDCQTKLPMVVAYRTARDLGNAKRYSKYIADPVFQKTNPACHVNLNHRFNTYQSKLRHLNIADEYDVGHLAMSNHLDDNDETSRVANYFTNLAPQVSAKNRSGGAWYATEKIVECHRDIEPLINLVGVVDDPSTTNKDYFKSSFGQTTPDYWWRIIYFEHTDKYAAWYIPNVKEATEDRLYSGDYDITLVDLRNKIDIRIPELETLIKNSVIKADNEFIKTTTSGPWLTCRGERAHIS